MGVKQEKCKEIFVSLQMSGLRFYFMVSTRNEAVLWGISVVYLGDYNKTPQDVWFVSSSSKTS